MLSCSDNAAPNFRERGNSREVIFPAGNLTSIRRQNVRNVRIVRRQTFDVDTMSKFRH